MVHGAIYDAANSASCALSAAQCLGQQYLVTVAPTPGVVPQFETAIDYAAYTTLRAVFPSQNFDADLATAQSDIPASASRTEGQRVGTVAANTMINARANDGSTNNTPYTWSTDPGFWRPTGSGPPATPNWGLVTPFTLTSGSQFRPPPPAGISAMPQLLASTQYATNFNDVKDLGRYNSTSRTADQTQAAFFWANDVDTTYKPPGQHFAHTQAVSRQQGLTQAGNARLFALVALAMADAAITAWDSKYLTPIDLWRPETAIHLALDDGNGATSPDSAWLPLSVDRNGNRFSPPFPAYISGHATFVGAWAATMRGFFTTDNVRFTGGTDDPNAVGVTRTFNTFTAAAQEDARSRIYLGVHFQFDADSGVSAGTSVGNYLFANRLRPVSSYTFTGFYESGFYYGDVIDSVAAPTWLTIQFRLTTSSGATVSDLGAITGYSWNGNPGSVQPPTFNASTGRYEIRAYVSKSCGGRVYPFTVLLRDGTSHTVQVDCDVV